MTEENKNIEAQEDESKQPISIARRNLRLLKRIALGKNKPPFFLRTLCWIGMTWEILMILYWLFVGIAFYLPTFGLRSTGVITGLGAKYFFTYAVLHAIALFGILLMWRVKKTGFYIYAVVTGIMPFLQMIMARQIRIDLTILLFSGVAIGLFALNWKLFNKEEADK